MTDVLLVDYETTGHHLEYAGSLVSELGARFPDLDVTFLTDRPTPAVNRYLPDTAVKYLRPNDGEGDDRVTHEDALQRAIRRPQRARLSGTLDHAATEAYEVVHFLHVDNLLQVLWKYAERLTSIPAAVVGSINGAFFGTKTFPRGLDGATADRVRSLLETAPARAALRYLPNLFSYRRPWKDAFLSHILDADVFHDVFVPTESGADYVRDLAGDKAVTVVPDPITVPDESELPRKEDAREALGLPPAVDVALFFGELRREKGVRFMLDALARYGGPTFSMVIAGKPVDVTPSDVEALAANPDLALHTELGFVDEDDVARYFAASDVVVLPYDESFGRHRPSNVLNQSFAHGRPVVVPDFGVFSNAVLDGTAGDAYVPGDHEDFRQTVRAVLDEMTRFSTQSIRSRAQSQTYGRLAEIVGQCYTDLP